MTKNFCFKKVLKEDSLTQNLDKKFLNINFYSFKEPKVIHLINIVDFIFNLKDKISYA